MRLMTGIAVFIFACGARAACNSYMNITVSGMTTLSKVAKVDMGGSLTNDNKVKLKVYFSTLKTFQGQDESCKYFEVDSGPGHPGNDTVREWARMATVAMTLNYDLNFDLRNTNLLSYNGRVELVPTATP